MKSIALMAKEQDLQPLLDTQQNQLALAFGDGDAIDTKALALLGTNVAILIFAAQASLRIQSPWLQWLLVGSLVVSLIMDGLAAWPRRYIGAGIDIDDHPEYLAMDKETLILQLLADTQLA